MRWAGGDLPELVAARFDRRVIASAVVHSGDGTTAYKVRLDNRSTVFVKTQPRRLPTMFSREADGLAWLGETNTVRVPRVLAVQDDPDPEVVHRFLVLEWIEPGPPSPDHEELLGRALAALHRFPCARFGLEHDNDVGVLPQDNTPAPTWPELYAHRRLEPLVRRAVDAGHLPPDTASRVAALGRRLPELAGPAEPPARLHGDLWRGNVISDRHGGPVLVDPAVYGGHREMDLAMMQLFGGFGGRVFDAYDEVHPRAAGHAERVGLWQLYPLLVHVNLFGAGYASSLLRTLARYE